MVRVDGNRHNKARTLSTYVTYPGHDSEAIFYTHEVIIYAMPQRERARSI